MHGPYFMNKGIFITGTDTGVGKTFVAAGLITAFKESGYSVCPLKPVETGCRIRKGQHVTEDAVSLIKAAEVTEPLDLINPYRFRQPLAPAIAAEMDGMVINKKRIISAYTQLSSRYDITIVEGAGGIMAPLRKKYLFIDLIKDLRLPVVIVARPGLGTINHTLLTINVAKNRGIKVTGVIISHSAKQGKDVSVRTNAHVIEETGGIPVLGTIPYFKNIQTTAYLKTFREIAGELIGRI